MIEKNKCFYNKQTIIRVSLIKDEKVFGYEIRSKKWYRRGGVYSWGEYFCSLSHYLNKKNKTTYYDKLSNRILHKPYVLIDFIDDFSKKEFFETYEEAKERYDEIKSYIDYLE